MTSLRLSDLPSEHFDDCSNLAPKFARDRVLPGLQFCELPGHADVTFSDQADLVGAEAFGNNVKLPASFGAALVRLPPDSRAHLLEPLIDAPEALVHAFKAPIDSLEASIDSLEASIDSAEFLVEIGTELVVHSQRCYHSAVRQSPCEKGYRPATARAAQGAPLAQRNPMKLARLNPLDRDVAGLGEDGA